MSHNKLSNKWIKAEKPTKMDAAKYQRANIDNDIDNGVKFQCGIYIKGKRPSITNISDSASKLRTRVTFLTLMLIVGRV